jgi:Zn-dependent protease
MIKIIKRWLILMGIIYLAARAAGNIAFANGVTTIAILAVLIIIGQGLAGLIKKSLLSPLNKITLGLLGLALDLIAVNLMAFLFNQIQFSPFDPQRLTAWFSFLPQVNNLTGFWSLTPFSAIITLADSLLNNHS